MKRRIKVKRKSSKRTLAQRKRRTSTGSQAQQKTLPEKAPAKTPFCRAMGWFK